ncbi:hypothetical protein B9479_006061 [Cryptococcus floricola]|uniref:CCHC-type domain-containing protein n=1 Tax=Cryptococcus floricola TaxID=2591691 RepID=A0A5D3AP36_9TREE|nr:hypothetical protein B9479_006061 [Cryptococcus floricola]
MAPPAHNRALPPKTNRPELRLATNRVLNLLQLHSNPTAAEMLAHEAEFRWLWAAAKQAGNEYTMADRCATFVYSLPKRDPEFAVEYMLYYWPRLRTDGSGPTWIECMQIYHDMISMREYDERDGKRSSSARRDQQGGGGSGTDRRSCFACRQKGHISRECPTPKKSTKPKSGAGTVKGKDEEEATILLPSFCVENVAPGVEPSRSVKAKHGGEASHTGKTIPNKKSFLVTTGAAHHITPQRSLLTSLRPCSGNIILPNSDRLPISAVGVLSLRDDKGDKWESLEIKDVLHVPGAIMSVLSIGQLCREGWGIDFGGDVMKRGQTVVGMTRVGHLLYVSV